MLQWWLICSKLLAFLCNVSWREIKLSKCYNFKQWNTVSIRIYWFKQRHRFCRYSSMLKGRRSAHTMQRYQQSQRKRLFDYISIHIWCSVRCFLFLKNNNSIIWKSLLKFTITVQIGVNEHRRSIAYFNVRQSTVLIIVGCCRCVRIHIVKWNDVVVWFCRKHFILYAIHTVIYLTMIRCFSHCTFLSNSLNEI